MRSAQAGGPVWSAMERQFAMTRDARLSALHRGGFSPGAALPSPWAPAVLQRRAFAFRIRAASSSQPGRSAWRAGSRASRGKRLQAACRRTPRLAPPSGCLRRRPSMSKAGSLASTDAICSQAQNVVKELGPTITPSEGQQTAKDAGDHGLSRSRDSA
jgi:hypothetical protein